MEFGARTWLALDLPIVIENHTTIPAMSLFQPLSPMHSDTECAEYNISVLDNGLYRGLSCHSRHAPHPPGGGPRLFRQDHSPGLHERSPGSNTRWMFCGPMPPASGGVLG